MFIECVQAIKEHAYDSFGNSDSKVFLLHYRSADYVMLKHCEFLVENKRFRVLCLQQMYLFINVSIRTTLWLIFS